MDGSSQQSGAASRVMPKNDVDNGPASNERRERATGLDKERLLAKGNKYAYFCHYLYYLL